MSFRQFTWRTIGRKLAAALVAGAVILPGCAAVGPDYTPPQMSVPDTWSKDDQAAEAPSPAQWWQGLNDPVLADLIQRAVEENRDLQTARSRVRQVRFEGQQTAAARWPSVDAAAAARRSETRGERGAGAVSDLYTAGFDAAWELDLFGGVRRSVEAARADLDAADEDLGDVLVSLLAEVAVNYATYRTYQSRLAVAEKNVAAQAETWRLLHALLEAGSGDALAVSQARYNLESSRAKVPDLNTGLAGAANRLAVLTGQPAGTLSEMLGGNRALPDVPADLAVGVPADVIRQRPDIRRAERELAAETARVGVAEAARYPALTLGGTIGVEALSPGGLFSGETRSWSLGTSFTWPIFDGGALRSAVDAQDERRQQARLAYESTVLTALEDVENALVAYRGEQQKLTWLQGAAEAARTAAALAEHLYTTGMTGFSDVLDAQRSLLAFEDQLAESRGAVWSDLVRLYKALGGGWAPDARPFAEKG